MKHNLKMVIFAAIACSAVFFGADATAMQYVGLLGAVVAVSSAPITNTNAIPVVLNRANIARGRILHSRGYCALVSGDSIGSTYRFTRIKSNDLVQAVLLDCDAVTTCAADFGLYQTAPNGGAVVDADFFASAQSLASALRATDITRESGVITLANMEKRVWELLGLSADPQREYDVAATLTAAAGSAGNVTLQVNVVGGA
jgi:hypothetical protein